MDTESVKLLPGLSVEPRTWPWPTEAEIQAAHAPGRDLTEATARDWSTLPLETCEHPRRVNLTALSPIGTDWHLEMCPDCGDVKSTCNHRRFEWNAAGTLLRCACCGIDGT